MKTLLAILVLLFCSVAVQAGNKKDVPVYDQIATASYHSVHYDSTASVTAGDHTYESGCNFYDTHVDCTDDTSGYYDAKFTDGTTMQFDARTQTFMLGKGHDILGKEYTNADMLAMNPLSDRLGTSKERLSFKYRLVHLKTIYGSDWMCVPFTIQPGSLNGQLIGINKKVPVDVDVCYQIFIAPAETEQDRRLKDDSAQAARQFENIDAAPAPPTQTPEDAAQKAQQYADCLKAAVNNPSIVCKQ